MIRNNKDRIILLFTSCLILFIMIFASFITDEMLSVEFTRKNQLPSLRHPFGTDWLGRDMFLRTVKGLQKSIVIGFISSFFSSIIALIIGGLAATMPKWIDDILRIAIDLVMGIPHLVLIILISVLAGRGMKGLIVGITLTHWPSLARIVRSEIIQVRNEQYVLISKKFGKSNWYIFKNHMIPIVFRNIWSDLY